MYVPVNPCIVRLGLYRQDALLCHRSDVHHSVGTQCRVGGWLSVHVEDPPRWTLQVKLNTLLHKQNKTKHHHQQDIRHAGRLHPHTRALRHTYIRTDNKNTVFICFPSHEDVQLGSLVSVGVSEGRSGLFRDGDTSSWTAFSSGLITYSEITLEYQGEGAEVLCDEPRVAGGC